MCDEDAIVFDEGSISHETYKLGDEFVVTLKVKKDFLIFDKKTSISSFFFQINSVVDVPLRCVIVPVDKAKLWDEYQLFKRRPKTA